MFARSALRSRVAGPMMAAGKRAAFNGSRAMSTARIAPARFNYFGLGGAAAVSAAVGAYGLYSMTENQLMMEKKANAGVAGTDSERTYIMLKPDGVQRGLIADVIKRFEQKGYKLVALKMTTPSRQLAMKHYEDLKSKPFYKGLVDYICSGTPVVCMVWEGKDVIKTGRKMLGATNPLDSQPGTIRGDYCVSIGRNIIHGSDSFDAASDEIGLWFTDEEINDWKPTLNEWINSAN